MGVHLGEGDNGHFPIIPSDAHVGDGQEDKDHHLKLGVFGRILLVGYLGKLLSVLEGY